MEVDDIRLIHPGLALPNKTKAFGKVLFFVGEAVPPDVSEHLVALVFNTRLELSLKPEPFLEVDHHVGKLLAAEHEASFVENIQSRLFDDAEEDVVRDG